MKKKKTEHIIAKVLPGSIAEELEVEAGDVLLSIDGQTVEDIFDYRYLTNEEYLVMEIRKADGQIWELEIEKEYEDDPGLVFDNPLMDGYHSCSNKCIFCFIDQLPPGMRKTLYFKDDDSRLSFLQGNYVTLTNIARSGAREAAITTNEELQDGRYRNIETHYKNQIDTLMTSFYVKSNDPVIIEETEDQKGVRAIINMNLNVHGFFADMILPESFGVQYYMRKEPTS